MSLALYNYYKEYNCNDTHWRIIYNEYTNKIITYTLKKTVMSL